MVIRPLQRKLLRDAWHLRGQVIAIALVIGAGICAALMSFSTLDSLQASRARFYAEYGFTQLFAPLKRAPDAVMERVREIPGIGLAESRVTASAKVVMPDYPDPVRGLLISLPRHLNRLYVKEGRLPEPRNREQIVIAEAFAQAHDLHPGDHLAMVVRGKRFNPTIVGIVLSPEYIYQAGPGDILPDFKRFAIAWMDHEALSIALDMDGAFNDLVATLAPSRDVPGASPVGEQQVLERIDLVLKRWGGLGAYGREDQQSHRFLSLEFEQLEFMGTLFSVIFLGVLAFLLHIVVGRLVDTQRDQIAILKAFGYGNAAIGWHFAQLVLVIVVLGAIVGILAGAQMGRAMAGIYQTYYRLPELVFHLRADLVVQVVAVASVAALAGAAAAVRKAVSLPPAEGMRPEPPAVFRRTLAERLGLHRWMAPVTRMMFRQMERRPFRSLFTTVGVAMATGIMISGLFFPDAMDYLVDVEFRLASREDLAAVFVEPTERKALYELHALPGVQRAEPYRTVPIKLRKANRERRTIIMGFEDERVLHRLLDARLRPIELPSSGLVASTSLAEVMGLRAGDVVEIEMLEGRQDTHRVEVAGTVEQYVGIGAYMRLDALNRLTREGDVISGVYLDVEGTQMPRVISELERRPWIAGTRSPELTMVSWNETFQEVLLTFTGFISAMAAAITLGVVYNGARIALSERARELASLRVLGFTRGEISRMLLGELALLVLLAVPLGFGVGWVLARAFAAGTPKELFVIPVVIAPDTYAWAATTVLLAAMMSAALVRRKLNQLDLVSALKTRE